MRRLIIAITGASGAIYGIRALEVLRRFVDIETHLILSEAAKGTITEETGLEISHVGSLADVTYQPENVGAAIASGSFQSIGMLVAPCSVKTLSAIANSYNANLIARAADVQVKEGRPVVLLLRETPLHLGHLRLMTMAAEQGVIIMPPVPAFYGHPKSIDDLVNATVGRALLRLGVENDLYHEWKGPG